MSELQDLWQSAKPDIDTERLISRLQRQNRMLRRVNLISLLISLVSMLIILLLEILGRLPTKGLLSLAGAVTLIWSVWKYRRDKARLIAAYSEEPGKLLPFLIERTRKARNLGRWLYLTPLPSVGLGYGVGYLFDDGVSADAVNMGLLVMVLIPALAFLVSMTIFGLWLARTKSRQLKELIALQDEMQA